MLTIKNYLQKIDKREVKIGIIGLGYVGLPLVIEFLKKNFTVYGFDNDIKKINMLKKKQSYINYINLKSLTKRQLINFFPTNKFSNVQFVDIIIICLPTPLNKKNNPDLSFIKNGLKKIKNYLKKDQMIILESTTYPGTTKEIIFPILKQKKYQIGKNYYVSYSPERQDPGNTKFGLRETPKLVAGASKNCLRISVKLYQSIVKSVIKVNSLEVAELSKLYENIFRSINIGLANEMKIICEKIDIDFYDVIKAASTKPFGFLPFFPGPGLGGHCIPIDPYYLKWVAEKNNVKANFIELSAKINNSMPYYVVNKVIFALKKYNKIIVNSNILIIGVSYKKNVDDTRESPSLKIIEILKRHKAKVDYYDPFVPLIKHSRKYKYRMKSIKISKFKIQKYDCVILLADHDNLPYKIIKKYSNLIVDTRGKFKKNNLNIFSA